MSQRIDASSNKPVVGGATSGTGTGAGTGVTADRLRRVSSLPMYDQPHLQRSNDLFWQYISERLREAGVEGVRRDLDRESGTKQVWLDPKLLLSQTCGYPLVKDLRDAVQLVATPRYKAPGCREGYYRSCIVVRKNDSASWLRDLRGKRCAINEATSNSGMNLFRALLAPLAQGAEYFESVRLTGSHFNSIYMVAKGLVDVASIDCVTFAHLQTGAPELYNAVKVIGWSDESPSLPFITSASTDRQTLRVLQSAFADAAIDPALKDVRETLLIDGFEFLPIEHYEQILDVEKKALELGYPEIV